MHVQLARPGLARLVCRLVQRFTPHLHKRRSPSDWCSWRRAAGVMQHMAEEGGTDSLEENLSDHAHLQTPTDKQALMIHIGTEAPPNTTQSSS